MEPLHGKLHPGTVKLNYRTDVSAWLACLAGCALFVGGSIMYLPQLDDNVRTLSTPVLLSRIVLGTGRHARSWYGEF